MQKKVTKTASNAASLPTTRNIDEIDMNYVVSALCGGSGVGQAPELPHKADGRTTEKLQVRDKNLQGSPEPMRRTPELPQRAERAGASSITRSSQEPSRSPSSKRLDLHGLGRQDLHGTDLTDPRNPISENQASETSKQIRENQIGYEIGKRIAPPQEKIIWEKMQAQKTQKETEYTEEKKKEEKKKKFTVRVRQKKLFWAPIVRCFESSNKYARKIFVPRGRTPRYLLNFALSRASYFLLILGFAAMVWTYAPVMKAETHYQFKKILTNTIKYYPILTNTNQSKNKNRGNTEARNGERDTEKNSNETMKQSNNVPSVLPVTAAGELKDVQFPSDSSIMIPKIDAAATIVPNVDPANYEEYMAALRQGVAHAKGTVLPGMKGNSYLFAHSAGNLFDIARFNAVFYLIGKLEKGDAIYVKFGAQKFKYTVIGKKEVEPGEVGFLTGGLKEIKGELKEIKDGDRVLTLQTCVPPGTDWRRLLVFAKIEEVGD